MKKLAVVFAVLLGATLTVGSRTVPRRPEPPVPLRIAQAPAIVSWQWDFGDGMTSTEQNPEHIYRQWSPPSKRKTFMVTLTVRDELGHSATATHYVTVRK